MGEESWGDCRRGIMGGEGGIMVEESWRRNHGGGIMASVRHLGDTWGGIRRHLGGIWEESGRHLEVFGRHLRVIWGRSMRPGGILEPERHLGGQMCSNTVVLSAKVARPTISRTRHELDLHVDGKFTAT